MTRVLSPAKPRLSAVNYPWMSYARPTLISQIVRKGRKVSINPRNEDEAAPVSVAGVSPEKELWVPFRSSAKDDEKEDGKNVVVKNHGRARRERAFSINLVAYSQEYVFLANFRELSGRIDAMKCGLCVWDNKLNLAKTHVLL